MKVLLINGSPNKEGNTVELAKALIGAKEYETLNLTDYKIYSYGQSYGYDQLNEVISKISEADIVVIGSPLYRHNICGSVRNMLDRFYGLVEEDEFIGKELCFVFQGAAPENGCWKQANLP